MPDEILCLDFETTGLDWFRDEVVPTLLSIHHRKNGVTKDWIIPLVHPEFENTIEDIRFILYQEGIIDLLKNPNVATLAHNFKYDCHILFKYGITDIKGRMYDTMLLAHLLDENRKVGLKNLTAEYFPERAGYEKDVDYLGPYDQLSEYARWDTQNTLDLFDIFYPEIIKQNLEKYYHEIIEKSFWKLFHAEHNGALIDKDYVEKSIDDISIVIENRYKDIVNLQEVRRFQKFESDAKIHSLIDTYSDKRKKHKPESHHYRNYTKKIQDLLSGSVNPYEGLNINSPSQLSKFLYTKYGLGLKGKGTGREILMEIDHPIVDKILAYRTLTKLKGTYYEGILSRLDANDRLHTSFLQHGTTSGRLCVGYNTVIVNAMNDKSEKIGDIVPDEEGLYRIPGYTIMTHQLRPRSILAFVNKGKEKMYEVRGDNGVITCTLGHKFYVSVKEDSTSKREFKSLEWILDNYLKVTFLTVRDKKGELKIVPMLIDAIIPKGEMIVYDIMVDEDESYIANGFINHNSSRDPNLQNIPSRLKFKDDEVEEFLRRVKKFFIAPEGYKVVSVDFSQAELRSISNTCMDDNMIKAYQSGEDLHAVTGSRIANMSLEDFKVSDNYKDIRSSAKNANFGLVYGISDRGYQKTVWLGTGNKLSNQEVKKHRDAVFGSYPGIKRWHDKYKKAYNNLCKLIGITNDRGKPEYIAKIVQESKFRDEPIVYTYFGRPRRILSGVARGKLPMSSVYLQMINSPIQGTSSEYTLLTIIYSPEDDNCIFFNTVHDSIMFYIKEEHISKYLHMIKDTAENYPFAEIFGLDPQPVKMKVDCEVGESWGELIEI